jgi:hypothetical protein
MDTRTVTITAKATTQAATRRRAVTRLALRSPTSKGVESEVLNLRTFGPSSLTITG